MPPKVFSAFGGYLKSEPSPSFILPLSIIYCLIIAGLSLLTTICAKKRKIIIKIDEIESFFAFI